MTTDNSRYVPDRNIDVFARSLVELAKALHAQSTLDVADVRGLLANGCNIWPISVRDEFARQTPHITVPQSLIAIDEKLDELLAALDRPSSQF